MKYWIGVASRDHVQRSVAGGFAQLGHGKRTGLARLEVGDWIAYYSPRTRLEGGDPMQTFTAIGRVKGEVFQISLERFCPFRRDVAFMTDATDASIKPLIAKLSFIKDPQRWGYPLMRGQLEVSAADMLLIAGAMGISLGEVPV